MWQNRTCRRERENVSYIGPFGMVVLELALQGDGGHKVLIGRRRG